MFIQLNPKFQFILWAASNFDLKILPDFISAPPTAELEPITADYSKSLLFILTEHPNISI